MSYLLPPIGATLEKRKTTLLIFVVVAMLSASAFLLFTEKKFLAQTTALPANPLFSDKGIVFNSQLQQIYSSLGVSDDIDKYLGTAKLDTMYYPLVEKHHLVEHYGIKKSSNPPRKEAIERLKTNTRVLKTDYGELQIKVWDKSSGLAVALANDLMENLSQFHTKIAAQFASLTVQNLQLQRDSLEKIVPQTDELKAQLTQYSRLINEWNLQKQPPSLYILEKASPSLKPDKPKVLLTLVATFVLSFLFGLLIITYLQSSSSTNKNGMAS